MLLCFVVKKTSYLLQEHHRHHRQPPYISQQQLTKASYPAVTTELKMTIGHIISMQRMSTMTVNS